MSIKVEEPTGVTDVVSEAQNEEITGEESVNPESTDADEVVVDSADDIEEIKSWNTPVQHAAPTAEQQRRLEDLVMARRLTAEETMAMAINMQPLVVETDDENTENNETESPQTVDAAPVTEPQFHSPAEESLIDNQLKILGVSDGDVPGNKYIDPNVPIDVQSGISHIQSQTVSVQHFSSAQTVEPTPTETVETVEVEEPTVENIEVEKEQRNDTETSNATDAQTETHSSGDETVVIVEEEKESEPVSDEVSEAPSDVSDADDETVIFTEEMDSALSDLPESTIDITEIENAEQPTIVTDGEDEQLTEPATEEDESTDSETEEQAVTENDALDTIVNILSQAQYGEGTKPIFVAADTDVTITPEEGQKELDSQHLVLSNMTDDELSRYSVESDPEVLRQAAVRLFGKDSNITAAIEEGLAKLGLNLLDQTSYVRRVHMSNQQFNNPATRECKKNLTATVEHLQKEKQEKGKNYLSNEVIIRSKDGKLVKITDNFASKENLFSKISANGVGQVQGSSATKISAMLINGLRTLNLYHSGFHVHLTTPRLDLLAKYYNTISEQIGEFGRILGQLAYLPLGVETRSALFDLFESLVEGSNLENWQEPGVLRNAISVLDIPVIAWGMASLMYPTGVEIEYLCNNTNEDGSPCRHVERTLVDINKMRYNDWTKMTPEQIKYVNSKEKRTLENLAEYREKYCNAKPACINITVDGSWKVIFRIPSVKEAEERQKEYISQMVSQVQVDKLQQAETYFKSKYLSSLAPYVERVRYTEPTEQKSLDFVDATALEKALDNLQLDPNVNLPEKLSEYLSERTLTHICFAHNKCPKCGKYPGDAEYRLAPCDAEYAFFVWAIAKLRR